MKSLVTWQEHHSDVRFCGILRAGWTWSGSWCDTFPAEQYTAS